MRLGLAIGCVVLAACAAPPSDGGLWARTAVQQELAIGRVSDDERVAAAHAQELRIADETLSSEEQRLQTALQGCPGPRTPLAVSQASTLRDSVRVRVGDDAARSARVAQQALGDWYLRRAAATGAVEQCGRARQAMDGTLRAGSEAAVLTQLGQSVVSRHLAYPGDTTSGDAPIAALVEYALGWTDTVAAPAPLPEHLATVYGGSLQTFSTLPDSLRRRTPQDVVDDLAPASPQWEPDALLLALQVR